ncbi:MAG: hypothetical protein QNL33_01045 [Akkermansiaceae bacterium]|jgi:hypothetical protein
MHPAIITALATCGFVAIWCFVFKILSVLSWGKLAQKYTSYHPPSGSTLKWQSLVLGRLMNYNRCVTIHVGGAGLFLEMPRFFRFAHPPLRIPWSEVRYLKEVKTLAGRKYLYDLGTPRITRIAFHENVHRAIQEWPGA